jgi:hypothetical protein
MKPDHDQALLIKAQLSDLLDSVSMTDYAANPVQYLLRLEALRERAAAYGFSATAEIAATFEATLQRMGSKAGNQSIFDSFYGILHDAIGVAHLHPAASEALLASIAIRYRS